MKSYGHLDFTQSDHVAVVIEILLPSLVHPTLHNRGVSPYWKLNSSHLYDEDFTSSLELKFPHLQSLQPLYQNLGHWWTLCFKETVKRLSRSYGVASARTKKSYSSYLRGCLEELRSSSEISPDDYDDYIQIKKNLEQLEAQQLESLKVLGKPKNPIEFEGTSAAFSAIEMRKLRSKEMK